MRSNTFADDKLLEHWKDKERAKKFLSGGTRTKAVKQVISHLQNTISSGIWIDVATGAGYVQTQISPSYSPSLFVGIDISDTMLRTQKNRFGELILGSVFQLPIRKNASSVTSIFFSLSDYPDTIFSKGIEELSRTVEPEGLVSFTDYNEFDDYWRSRQSQHGKIIQGKKIIGNINLRSLNEIIAAFPDNMGKVFSEVISYEVDTSEIIVGSIKLPDTITRAFSFVMFRK